MSDDRTSLSRRLMARGESGLMRRATPDGGEVVSGPVATRALTALGARAMTMDNTIFVAEDFDINDPQDQALYAHERFHQMESGGMDGGEHAAHDAEETAARTIERAVLRRSETGEDLGAIMRDVLESGTAMRTAASPGGSGSSGVSSTPTNVSIEGQAVAGYQAMLASGKSHEAVIRDLARHVLENLRSSERHGKTLG